MKTKLVRESLDEGALPDPILDELNAEWKPLGVDVGIVDISDNPDDYGYGDNPNDEEDYRGEGNDDDGPVKYVKYQAFNFDSTDDKMDEKVQLLSLEVLTDDKGDKWCQWWYDASPIISGDNRSLLSDPQPYPCATAEQVLEEISEDEDEDENQE